MGLLNRESILQAQDLKSQDVSVPEWGGDVRVRVLTGAERDAFGAMLVGEDGKPNMDSYKVKFLALCMIGEDGKQLFTMDDVDALRQKSAAALERVFGVADKLNELGIGAVEKAEGN